MHGLQHPGEQKVIAAMLMRLCIDHLHDGTSAVRSTNSRTCPQLDHSVRTDAGRYGYGPHCCHSHHSCTT
jgi:hypothetical protein